jgi:hypothetical protein
MRDRRYPAWVSRKRNPSNQLSRRGLDCYARQGAADRGEYRQVFFVKDHNGQQLAYVYFEDEPGRRSAAKLLTKDEARADRGEYRQVARDCQPGNN